MLPKGIPGAARRLFFSLPHPLLVFPPSLPVAVAKIAIPSRGKLSWKYNRVGKEQGAADASKVVLSLLGLHTPYFN